MLVERGDAGLGARPARGERSRPPTALDDLGAGARASCRSSRRRGRGRTRATNCVVRVGELVRRERVGRAVLAVSSGRPALGMQESGDPGVPRQVAQVLAHLGGAGGAVQADHVDAERLERGQRGADLGAQQHRAGGLDGDLDDERQRRAGGGHRALARPMTAALACSRSWQVSMRSASAPPAIRPRRLLCVGVAQRRRTATWPRVGSLVPGPIEPSTKRGRLGGGPAVGRLAGDAGRRPAKLVDALGDAVLAEVGEVGAEGVGLDAVDARPRGRRRGHAAHDVGPGDVEDLVAALVPLEVVEGRGRWPGASCPSRRRRRRHARRGRSQEEARSGCSHGHGLHGWYGGLRRATEAGRDVGWSRSPQRGQRGRPTTEAWRDRARRTSQRCVDPVMIAAFEGWNDAGEAATPRSPTSSDVWDAEPIAALDPEDYYDFQVNRPVVVVRRRATPRVELADHADPSLATPPGTDRDVDPGAGHRADHALAGLLPRAAGASPSGSASRRSSPSARCWPTCRTPGPCRSPAPSDDEDIAAALRPRAERVRGPDRHRRACSQDACAQAGMPAVSCWAAVPHYVAQPPCPKATLALLRQGRGAARRSGAARRPARGGPRLGARRRRAGREDDEVAEYVRALEEAQDTADLPEASGDAIAREFERYLRRRGDRGEHGGAR